MATAVRRVTLLPYLNIISGTVLLFLCLGYSYALLNFNRDGTGINQLVLLMLLQLTPFLFLVTRGRFNFLGFILFNHFITYSVAKYNQLKTIHKATSFNSTAIIAIREMIYCTVLIISSYYVTRYLVSGTRDKKEKYEYLTMSRNQYLYGGILVMMQPILLHYVPVAMSTMYFVVSSLVLIALLCSRTENIVLERWIKVGIVGSTLYYFLVYGSLAIVGTIGMLLFIVSFVQWRPRNFVFVFIIVVAATAIQSVKYEYRKALLDAPDMGVVGRAQMLTGLLVYQFIEGGKLGEEHVEDEDSERGEEVDEEFQDSLLKGFARVGDDSLERVLEMTPSIVPFWDGETYSYLPFMFIPRVLWQDKPGKLAWNKFGRLYHFLSSDDIDTSVGFNFLAEGYMNFGYLGLYSVSIIFGILIVVVERLSFYLLNGYFYFSFISFLIPLLTYGNDLVSMINSLVLTASVLLICRSLLTKMAIRDDYCL